MKKLLMMGLLAASAASLAQTPKAAEEARARTEQGRLEAEEAKTRTQLEEARRRLDEAAREVAELSTRLAHDANHDVWTMEGGPRRAILGVQIDAAGGQGGARVLSVSPGGPAEQAGLVKGDVIVALDDKKIAGVDQPNRAVVEHMRDVKPEQKVRVKVLRDGKNRDFVVVARPLAANRMFHIRLPDMGPGAGAGGLFGNMPEMNFRGFWSGPFGGMELASITPKLGAYFGASEGVLVVQAPEDAAFKLEDGDVIQAIDGRKPADGAHAMRILRSYKSGEQLTLTVLRQRKSLTLPVTMPEHPAGNHFMFEPGVPVPPPAPPAPPTPARGAGADA